MCHICQVIRVADYLYCLMLNRFGTGPWKTKPPAVLTSAYHEKMEMVALHQHALNQKSNLIILYINFNLLMVSPYGRSNLELHV